MLYFLKCRTKIRGVNSVLFQAGPRWVESIFNKRECIKFIPSSKDNARLVLPYFPPLITKYPLTWVIKFILAQSKCPATSCFLPACRIPLTVEHVFLILRLYVLYEQNFQMWKNYHLFPWPYSDNKIATLTTAKFLK